MKNLITCFVVCVLSGVVFAGNGTPVRGDCPAPTGLYASSDVCYQINLHWDPVDGATAYYIYRNYTNSFPSAVLIALAEGASFTDFSFCGVPFYYWVAVVGNCGDSVSDSAMGSCLPCNTWTVDDDGKADFDNIQAAVDASSDGDEIVVMPGTYTGTGDEVVNMMGKAVTLRSSDPNDPDVVASTIIDGENARRGLACYYEETSNTIISGFTITNGFSGYGGGMLNGIRVAATLTNCTFENNTATYWGGGMYNVTDSFPTLTNCTITGNTAGLGGGMYNDISNPMLTNCTVCSNTPNQISGYFSDEGGNTVAAICPVPGACCTNDGCVISEQEDCITFLGQWLGEGTTCEDNPCPTSCFGDVTGDGQVDVSDILVVISVWGTCQ